MEQSNSGSSSSAAMPVDSTSKEHQAIRSDDGDGFWDKSVEQPAAEQRSAQPLPSCGKLPSSLATAGPASLFRSGAHQHIMNESVQGKLAAHLQQVCQWQEPIISRI